MQGCGANKQPARIRRSAYFPGDSMLIANADVWWIAAGAAETIIIVSAVVYWTINEIRATSAQSQRPLNSP
jgi:hypothetical protein